ncbi:DNA-directed RNA polymerase phage-type [Trinorchestia longiramus]|nr:DNA-directed RNA polymerase phage-type [Trinorchestia longiramus]
MAGEYHYLLLHNWLLPMQWYHVCITRTGSMVQFFLDSKSLANYTLLLGVVDRAKELTVGFLSPKIYPGLTFIGNITQFNVWSRMLEPEDISRMSNCEEDVTGDLVAWGRNWTTVNSRIFEVDLHSLCHDASSSKLLLMPAMNFMESTYLCEGLGGTLYNPPTHDMVRQVVEYFRNRTDSECVLFWSGIWDEPEEGKWKNHFTGLKISQNPELRDVPWAPDEPNGMHFENCAGLDAEGFADDDCQRKRCGLCDVVMGRPWVLKGACIPSPHDRGFLLKGSKSSSEAMGDFVGFGDFVIVRDEDETWRWVDSKSSQPLATLVPSLYNYPIGRHLWKLNTAMCGQLEGMRQLSVTSCTAGQYTCNDATCVPLPQRCDLQFDCRDHSDEIDCKTLHLTHDYQASTPPRDMNGNLKIHAVIQLESLRISTQSMVLVTTFNLSLTWHDSRVTFYNLKPDHTFNVVPTNGTLWSPVVAFVNTIDHAGTVTDEKTVMYAHRIQKSSQEDDSFAKETELFFGSENPLTSHRQYQASFMCDFDLSLYPFDHQTCLLLLQLSKSSFGYFDAKSSSVSYDGIAVLLEYQVGKVFLQVENDSNVIKIRVPLARRHGYAFINVYLPSLTMLLIGFLTLFFHYQFFDTRVMTTLTTMLVMATISSQVATSLPSTSYFKMADVWLLFCIFSSFLVIVFHVLVERSCSLHSAQMIAPDAKTRNLESIISFRNTRRFKSADKIHPGTTEGDTNADNWISSSFVQRFIKVTHISEVQDTTVQKSPASKTAKKKKTKKAIAEMEAHIKALRSEHKARRLNSDLEAYLTVCVTAGMYNRAYHTLYYYRCIKSNQLTSVAAYNIVMRGLYSAGHHARVSHVYSWLLNSGLTPSACAYAIHIASLHKRAVEFLNQKSNIHGASSFRNSLNTCEARELKAEYSNNTFNGDNCSSNSMGSAENLVQRYLSAVPSLFPENCDDAELLKDRVSAVLDQMSEQGRSLEWLFSEANFVWSLYEDTLAGVRRVLPDYNPTLTHLHRTPQYTCSLLADANEQVDYTEYLRSKEDLRTLVGTSSICVPSPEAIEEQFAMEIKGKVSIPSVYFTVHNSNLKNKLEVWHERWRIALKEAYCTEVEKLRKQFFNQRSDKKMSLYPYLAVFTPEEMVEIIMQEIHMVGGSSEGNSLPTNYVYNRISESAFSSFSLKYSKNIGLLDKFKKAYTDYIRIYAANAERGLNPRVALEQVSQLYLSGPRLTHQPPDWPSSTKYELGKFLYGLIKNNVFVWQPVDTETRKFRVVEEVTRMTAYSTAQQLRPHPVLSMLYCEMSDLTFPHFELPMLSPPRPWMAHRWGGFLLQPTSLIRRPPNDHNFLKKFLATPKQQLWPCTDSLNALACTPWLVNGSILDVITEVFNNNSGADLDVPQHPSVLTPPVALHPNASKQDKAARNTALAQYNKKKNEMHSLWCTALYKLSIANYFRDRVFWFPHNIDFRGRAYPCPSHFSHFDSDVFRSLLIFAEPKPLGKKGLQWLKTHIINLTGFKKHNSLETRLQYCESILPEIFDSAERPLTGNRWWTTSDEPWQTLAACKELHAALHSPDPEAYLSRLPIHQDGSCNGLQHYAALGRDVEGARSVNLAPSPVPQDVYTSVATLVEKIRAKDASDPSSPHHDIATKLEGFIKRKVVKQTIMTTVYGVTRYGAILQIEKRLKELENFPASETRMAAAYLSCATFQSLEMMFEATKKIQDWFTECASLISKVCGECVEWVTPLGLPISQPYYKQCSYINACKNSHNFRRLPSSFLDSAVIPNAMKQRNAFPPNFIHSLDASHMMLTALYCHRNNLTFASVHDCYWTHACSVDTMSKICRDQFVALHSQPILTDLSKFICERYGFKYAQFTHDGSASDAALLRLNETLKAVPKLGDFDIELVKQSTFFFS